MAQFEELRITVNLVDNASAGLGQICAQLASLESLSRQSATGLQSLATSLTSTGTAATAATKGIQGVTQQTNAAIRATAGLTKEMAGLRQASTQLEQGFRSLGSAAQGLQALPRIGVGLVSMAQGMSGLGAALDKIGTSAKVAGMAIGGVAIAALAGAAAFVAWNVSVFRFARETRALSDSAKAVGVSFADLKNATENAKRFGIASETVIQSYAGIQKAMTDLSRNDSSLRHDMLSKGLDPAFLQSIEQEQEGWERINLVRQKALEIQAEQLRQGKSQTAAAGIAGEFMEKFGVNRTMLTRPAMQAPTEEQKAAWAKYEATSGRIMTIWDRVYSKVDALKGKVLGMGLDSLERLMRWIEQHWDEIDKFVTDTAKEILGMAPSWETIKSSVETIVNLLRGEVFEKGTIGAAIFGMEVKTPEERAALKKENEARVARGEAPIGSEPSAGNLWGAGSEVRRGMRAGEHHRGAVVGDPMGGLFFGGGGNLGQPTPGTPGAPNFDGAAALKELSDLSNWGGGPVPIPGSPGSGGWADVPQSENVIDLRKRDDHGELIEENTSVLANTNDQLKQLNDYLQDEAAKRRSAAAAAGEAATFDERFGGGGGGAPQSVFSGPSGGGGTGGGGTGGGVPSSSPPGTGPSSAPMGPQAGPSNVPGVATPASPFPPPPGAPPGWTGGPTTGGGGVSIPGGGNAKASGSQQDRIATSKAAMEDQLRQSGVPETNIKEAANLLAGQGLSESNLIPSTPHDPDRSGRPTGYGIYGARLDRRTKMLQWMKEKGFSPDSLEGQSRYMVTEALSKDSKGRYKYPETAKALMSADPATRAQAVQTLTREFENPKDKGQRQMTKRLRETERAASVTSKPGEPATAAAPAAPTAGPSNIPNVDVDDSVKGRVAGLAALRQDVEAAGMTTTSGYRDPHHKLSRANPRSSHITGLAFDTRAKTTAQVDAAMEKQRELFASRGLIEGRDYKFIDEVRRPSGHATAKHLHTQLTSDGMRRYQQWQVAQREQRQRTAALTTATPSSPGGGALDRAYAETMRTREMPKGDTFADRFTGGGDGTMVGFGGLPPEKKDTFADRFSGEELDRARTEFDSSNSGGPTKGQLNLRIGNMPRGTQWATEGDLFKNSKTETQSAMATTPHGGWEE